MQKFLNEEHARYSRLFRKPVWALALFVLVSASVSMAATGILCTTLTSLEQILLLEFGLIFSCFLAVFVVVPICMRLILNCLFKVRRIGTGLKNLPLSYRSSVQPAPPNSPAPRWALKSFRETMAKPETRLSSRT
jgi:hypothetical protein